MKRHYFTTPPFYANKLCAGCRTLQMAFFNTHNRDSTDWVEGEETVAFTAAGHCPKR